MRTTYRPLAVFLTFILVLSACTASDSVPTSSPEDPPPRFSFEETAALLEEREVLLSPLDESSDVVERQRMEKIVRKRLKGHSSWEVLSMHLAEVDMPNPHFEIYDQPTYVVEVTGPSTGNCFDFYLATTGRYQGGACFYPHRTH